MQKSAFKLFASKKRAIFIIALILITCAGAFFVWSRYRYILAETEEKALNFALSAETGFHSSFINNVDLNQSDLNKREYKEIKLSLIKLVSLNNKIRFAYILAKKNNEIYILADSEAADSKDYSPPGQKYIEATDSVYGSFGKGAAPLVTGPETDRWGKWISVLVPIKDPETGNVMAVFGVDYPAEKWNGRAVTEAIRSALFILALMCNIIGIYFVISKNKKLKSLSERLKKSEGIFRIVFEQAPIGIAVENGYELVSNINPMFEKITGRSKEELAGKDWTSFSNPDDLKYDLELYSRFKAGEIPGYSIAKRLIKPDGSNVWVNKIVAPLNLYNQSGKTHLCIIEDISESFKAEMALIESERSKAVVINNISGMAYKRRYGKNWTIEYISEGCIDLTGYKPDRLLRKRGTVYDDLVIPEHRENLFKHYKEAVSSRRKIHMEYQIVTASGEVKWVLEQGQGVYNDNGETTAVEGLIIDITARKMREEEIIYLNDHDNLTNLYNRSYFETAVKRLNSENHLPLSIIIGNINGLRLVNDAFGHAEGDKLIIETSQILQSCCREGDILARTGDDEFSLLLPGTDNIEAYAIYDSIKEACEKHNLKESNKDYHISISLGAETREREDQDFSVIMKRAEDEMFKCKLFEHKSSHSYIMSSIKTTLFEKSQETQEHAERIAELMKEVGVKLSLSPVEIYELEMLSMLHDIGKIGIDDRVLKKPDKLTDNEWKEMRKHPEIGYRIAMSSPDIASTAEFILCHHEHWDGSGYPKGLKGEDIPLLSRILAVVDAYDAMTQNRIYREAMPKKAAIEEIKRNSGKQFDPNIVNIFVNEVLSGRG